MVENEGRVESSNACSDDANFGAGREVLGIFLRPFGKVARLEFAVIGWLDITQTRDCGQFALLIEAGQEFCNAVTDLSLVSAYMSGRS